ncbi:hypothetical protein J7L05_02715 [bacterium]|nr:hypothetical protein [bacterium]
MAGTVAGTTAGTFLLFFAPFAFILFLHDSLKKKGRKKEPVDLTDSLVFQIV